jgi:hypothetical protein
MFLRSRLRVLSAILCVAVAAACAGDQLLSPPPHVAA